MADGKPSAIGYLLSASPFDLHVLGTPPAFILSQDQTLRKEFVLTYLGPKLSLTFLPLFSC